MRTNTFARLLPPSRTFSRLPSPSLTSPRRLPPPLAVSHLRSPSPAFLVVCRFVFLTSGTDLAFDDFLALTEGQTGDMSASEQAKAVSLFAKEKKKLARGIKVDETDGAPAAAAAAAAAPGPVVSRSTMMPTFMSNMMPRLPTAQPQSQSFMVQLPSGAGPGTRMTVTSPFTGQQMVVVVPPGVPPGGRFAVMSQGAASQQAV